MKIITSVRKMQEFSRQVRGAGLSLGFVPTMGYLHDGHIELVRRARAQSDVVVVSIFVNPTQFDRKDDFERYPRDEQGDRAVLEHEGVEVLFMPKADEVYAPGAATRVRVEGLTSTLCGPKRPGHFEGVATIVAALLNMVGPDRAWFGEKDYQQLQVIRRMAADLHIPVEIIGVETLREPDGLAMSSRNARLSAAAREIAPVIPRALRALAEAYAAGETDAARLGERARSVLAERPQVRVEYLEVVDGATLAAVATADDASVVAIAAWLDDVRLIDNVVLARATAARELKADRGVGEALTHSQRGATHHA
jgi:pantoate--beta-alanine ligase